MKSSISIVGLLTVVTLLSGCQQESAPPKTASVPVVSYVAVTTGEHKIDTKMQGRVVASSIAEVRPQVGGIVQQRLFNEGNTVEKGELLYQIDPATYQAAYNEAKANLNSAKASLETAKLKDERYANLLKFEGVSQQDADDVHATYLEAKANIEKYEAALASASINLEFTKVTAPISGHIGISNVTQGALVTAQQTTALATIRKLDPIYVDMTKSSKELLKLRQMLGSKGISEGTTEVSLTLEDGSEYDHKGQLKMQEVSVDASTGTVTLRAEFPNPNGLLLPGMFVRTQVNEAVNQHAILVPQQGIYHSATGEAYAYVIGENNLVEKRTVETVNAVENKWLISSGLSENDKLLVEGAGKVRPGSEVKPVLVEMTEQGTMITVVKQDQNSSSVQVGV
ncbi:MULTISPECIES: efflux RND transporter periplasmic adaptor subunit [Alteromonadaceae]|uniref:efflux RND transporter periplasmic adaptor subunit n=1 Tax=Alteromonadaceae TaxID=72275 RepID=UPI001C07F64B|nr:MULTISPECIES: efflux RND transporter periplasmic adaptor subunit [Aliiglaciecola]MBU2877612.1 efflux RND transporter periplasmic adaptor subunit [Aliiglaciecola lipolytica]MDO6711187.1 efflux RND transporter periplasmic adaptor subunit [Aliiglaciecola sp. 2_MG-2023]MDO6752101.1 efflux RND transporter periplasmic adaptor subunit [Aliiglaciecola sp. 1_MG-2023]